MRQPDIQLIDIQVLNLTVPDNALSSVNTSLDDTHFEEKALLPWFVEKKWIEVLLDPIGHKLHNDLQK